MRYVLSFHSTISEPYITIANDENKTIILCFVSHFNTQRDHTLINYSVDFINFVHVIHNKLT